MLRLEQGAPTWISMSSIGSLQRSGAGKEDPSVERVYVPILPGPRSSSPSRATDDEGLLEANRGGMVTRSASKRKVIFEQETSKECSIKQE